METTRGIRGFFTRDSFRSRRWAQALVIGAAGLLLVLVLPVAGVMGHVYLNRDNLPDLEEFLRFEVPTTGRVLDSRGEVIIEVAREYRRIVSYEDLPMILRQAILATEDRDFFRHRGIDYRALPRVLRASVLASSSALIRGDDPFRLRFPQGGSTITQQLVRGYFLQERTSSEDGGALFTEGLGPRTLSAVLGVPVANKLLRKLEEVRLSLWLEQEMTRRFGSRAQAKREILGRYASFIYLGNGRYGYAAASEYYFGSSLPELDAGAAGNAALLAGIGKSPNHYSPVAGNPEPLRRRNEILVLMAGHGYIADEEAERAAAEAIRVVGQGTSKTWAPAVIHTVFAELREGAGGPFGVEDLFVGRLEVHTTVDGRIQKIVNEALETGLALYEARHPGSEGEVQGSVVVLRNRDGAILAMAGGRQVHAGVPSLYTDFNRAIESLRQPGSAWKPIVYLAAFRAGLGLDSTVIDAPLEVNDGTGTKWISNYDGRFRGPMAARQALAESRNTVAVRVAREVGYDQVRRVAQELGITSRVELHESAALGASEVRLVELANVYRAMASGVLAVPHVIQRSVASSGAVLYRAPGPTGPLRPTGLREIQEGMRGVVRIPGGTARALAFADFPVPVMGKSGTTNAFRDALFLGSTWGVDGITVAVRIGFDDNRSLGSGETGSRAALPIFREIMMRTYADGQGGPVPAMPHDIERSIADYRLRILESLMLPFEGPSG
jgi:penicillin-binding protein 1A